MGTRLKHLSEHLNASSGGENGFDVHATQGGAHVPLEVAGLVYIDDGHSWSFSTAAPHVPGSEISVRAAKVRHVTVCHSFSG